MMMNIEALEQVSLTLWKKKLSNEQLEYFANEVKFILKAKYISVRTVCIINWSIKSRH
ncbi:Uncharacterised protein [Vibrio cholerae]|uniref:Uncharacterized protein n=1 Tax=Vibrio cholerae TaxID=666 RepID=A0A655SCI4_VIBCL|nr:Uncharacterised protein [Vibrio cholerae]